MRFTSWEAFSSHSVVMILQGASTQTEAKMGSKMAAASCKKETLLLMKSNEREGDGCEVGWCAC